MKKMAYEEYQLVLTHTYVDGDGNRTAIEDPVKVVQVFPLDRIGIIPPVAVCINDMMDRIKHYILRKGEEE